MILKWPDGRRLEVKAGPQPSRLGDLLKQLDGKPAKQIIGAKAAGPQPKFVDLYYQPADDEELVLLSLDSDDARWIYRHSMAHVMAQAVKRLFPNVKLAIGPAIEDGFYYDFDVERPFTPEDLEKISKEMQKVIKENHSFERLEASKAEARRMLQEQGEIYKLELLDEIPDEKVSFYRDGDFIDLCKGPHVPSTGLVKYFKLLEVAGAYWRGDEKNKMLQRIYGTAFYKKADLEGFLRRREEAQKRDHRKLGRELDLFSINEQVGPGLVLWHPKGAIVREEIENFWKAEHRKRGYQLVYTPHVGRAKLWEISGHTSFYLENMFPRMEVEGQGYFVKPMNCPFHIQIYRSQTRSYRELPLKLCEIGTVYRHERSGVLHGLLRVRMITQDDSHIFFRPDQAEEVISEVLDLAFYLYQSFGFHEYDIALSVRDPKGMSKYAGRAEDWDKIESILEAVLQKKRLPYQRMEGEANFYGPKIDIHLKDAIGRKWQCPTIQFDFNMPERFDCTYVGEDGRPHRPYVLHRALLGALERFFGVLIEHCAGAFPVWLAPVQAVVLPITERNLKYAEAVLKRLIEAGIRAELDYSSHKTLSYRIRHAQLQKIPYMLIVGDKEEKNGEVALRLRTEEDLGPKKLEEFIASAKERIERRAEL